MRWLAILLLVAGCQMQAGSSSQAPDIAGISDEAIAMTPLGAPPTAPAVASPTVAPPTAVTALPTAPVVASSTVAPPTGDAGLRPKPRPAGLGEAAEEAAPVAAISPEQALCEKAKGTWAKVGGAGRICVKPTRDAGKACDQKSDCKGECLAKSGTCAPISPLMGCNEVLDDEGRQMTQCLQ